MKPELDLTDLQLAVMKAIWELGEGSVLQVHSHLFKIHGLAPTTVSTMLSRLEKKGLLTHHMDGRQYIYSAVVSEKEVASSMVKKITNHMFKGNVTALVNHLLGAKDISPGDLEKVRSMLEEKASKGGRHGK